MYRFLAAYVVLLFQEQGGKLVPGICRQQRELKLLFRGRLY